MLIPDHIRAFLTDLAWLLGTILAIGTSLVAIWKKALKPYLINRFQKFIGKIRTSYDNLSALADMLPELRVLMPKMDKVVKAVMPNNGSSMPDALARVEIAIQGLTIRSDMNESLSDAMIYNHPKSMFRCDATGRNVFVNHAYARMLGVDNDDLIGLGWKSFVHPDDLLKYDAQWKQALSEYRNCCFHIRMVTSANVPLPLSIQFYVLRSSTGNFLGFLGMIDHHPDH